MSTRPLYWVAPKLEVLWVAKLAMSATPSNPPPRPGLVALVQPGSCVPKAVFKGDPISRPWPGMVLQVTPSVRPAVVQVALLTPTLSAAAPGKFRYCEAILPERANLSNAGVSYHPLAGLT